MRCNNSSPVNFECASQPEIAVVVRHGLAAAILPAIAGCDFSGSDVKVFDLSHIRAFNADLSLVWNPRALDLSPRLEAINGELSKALRLTPVATRI